MIPLVLSLFPGVGILDRAFEEEGFTVVRGPDVLWGGDVRTFHPPPCVFDGVIGGPPCQLFSGLANFSHRWKRPPENLIPEFERCVAEAEPHWFLMENVPGAPLPAVQGYVVHDQLLNNRWLGEEQDRLRRFSFGSTSGATLAIEAQPLMAIDSTRTVTASHGGSRRRMKGTIESLTPEEAARRQGLPEDFLERAPFTKDGKLRAIANGVPLPMGRAVAGAIKRALESLTA